MGGTDIGEQIKAVDSRWRPSWTRHRGAWVAVVRRQHIPAVQRREILEALGFVDYPTGKRRPDGRSLQATEPESGGDGAPEVPEAVNARRV